MSMFQEIGAEIKASRHEPSSRDLTILALLFLAILSAIGAYGLFWKGNPNGLYWFIAGAVLFLARLIPPLFRRIFRAWVVFSVVLGYFVSRILLTIIYFVVLTPTGLIVRLLGKDPMERKWDKNAKTYWLPKEQEPDTSIERYEKQF